MEFMERLGARILKQRTVRRMTALELARRTGLHRNTISRFEAGQQTASIENVWKICSAFGITIDSLLEDRKPLVHFQLELWPARRKHNVPSDSNWRSNVLQSMPVSVGRFGPGAAAMQTGEKMLSVRNGTE